jgi:glycogen debranching enzyme
VLTTASSLASWLNKTTLSTSYATNSFALKAAFNEAFWDDEAGMYRDNATTDMHPQDTNSYAVLFNLTQTDNQKQRISEGLTQNWNEIGAVAPELPDNISPFIGSFEACSFHRIRRSLSDQRFRSKPISSQVSHLVH